MVCDFVDPVYFNPETGDIEPIEGATSSDVIPFHYAGFDCGRLGEVIEAGDQKIFISHEASAGEMVIIVLLTFIALFVVFDFALSRIIPRFVRFWK